MRAVAQVSAHGRPVPCTVELGGDGATVRFDDPQRAVAPGQTVALYDEREPDAVLGAGIVS
jgi:tRNA-specific 2-thiouridylase